MLRGEALAAACHRAIRFQLALFWSTTSKSLIKALA
jgi:hypothetical protein